MTRVGPVALIEAWAAATPIAGFRCSGLLLNDHRLVTASHCLGGDGLKVVVGGSLCEPTPAELPSIIPGDESPHARLPAHDDITTVQLGGPTQSAIIRIGRPRPGPALVYGFGVEATHGRVACRPRTYDGDLWICGGDAPKTHWCLAAEPETQLCGGSSGAPVFMRDDQGPAFVGVVSGGPRCGEPGPVVVATFPDRP